MPVIDAIATPRPSCLAGLDRSGCLVRLEFADTDAAILDAVPAQIQVIGVDAPMNVPNSRGIRPVDQLMQWLDVPAFPYSRERLGMVFGGARGVDLLSGLQGRADAVVEVIPDVVFRELAWEADRPVGTVALDLAEYRAAWLGYRAPRYRPKGTGRAHPAGRIDALTLLSTALDTAGWLPAAAPDDWEAIRDAAVLDAIASAYAAWRLATAPERVILIGKPPAPVAVPADVHLRQRAELHGERLGVRVTDGRGVFQASDRDGA